MTRASRMARMFVAATGLAAAAAPPGSIAQVAILDTIGQRLQACTACHGKEGVANGQEYFPRIAGKPAGYLFNQLQNFKEGRRNNATMAAFVANMSDTYLMEIASYFADLDLPYSRPAAISGDAQSIARGKALVERGDAGADVPACVRCHGGALTGTTPSIPGLVGLRREYLLAQFGGWRTGQRHALEPDCMNVISSRLSTGDLGAIASYLTAQPVPEGAKAARNIVEPLPLDCGSAPK